MKNIPDLSCGKMCREVCPAIRDAILGQSLKASSKSRTKPYLFLCLKSGQVREKSWEKLVPLPGEYSTRSFGESPRDAAVCFLSRILEGDVPAKYYLSPKACQGILRRSKERGKELPEPLTAALIRQSVLNPEP